MPDVLPLLLRVLFTVFVAEMGDKTQFLMIAMADQYRVRDILLGVGCAICVLNALAIALGTLLGGLLPELVINLVAGAAFLYFAFSSLGESNEEHRVRDGVGLGAFLAVFGTFFLAELGDKTQLTALTMAAEAGGAGGIDIWRMVQVFLGAVIGLFAADLLGLLVGKCLGKALPTGVFSAIAFVIFTAFGIVRLNEGLGELFVRLAFERHTRWQILSMLGVLLPFAALCLHRFLYHRERGDSPHDGGDTVR